MTIWATNFNPSKKQIVGKWETSMDNVPSVLVATNNTKGVGFKINMCLGFCKLKWHTFSFEPYIGFGANGNMFGWGMLAMLLLGAFFFLSLVEVVHIILQVLK